MSGTLPIDTPHAALTGPPSPSAAGPVGTVDVITLLLAEQQSMTAVQRFSRHHDAGIATEPAQAKYYRHLMPVTPPSPGQQFAFEVDLDACSGCKACVVACHTLNGLDEDESWRRVGTLTLGEPGVQHVTTACHHCEDPACLNGCPVKAYDKDPVTGIVRHLDDQCIGCKYCVMMCPYEVPKYSKRLGIVRKCDMCRQRLGSGEAPACVQSCPNAAIAIRLVSVGATQSDVSIRHLPSDRPERLVPGAPLSDITRPTTRYTSRRRHVIDAATPQDDSLDQPADPHLPLAALLIATQVAVGMIVCERALAAATYLGGGQLPIAASRRVATAALVVAMIGMNLAPLHLGQPLRAWRVFLGLRTSWLSREAIVLGKFVGVLAVAAALLWFPAIRGYVPDAITSTVDRFVPDWAAAAALASAAVLGVAGVYCSGMIYIATKRPLWRSSRTLTKFFGTTLIVGGVAASALLLLDAGPQPAPTSGVSVTPGVLIALGIVSAAMGSAKLIWEWQIQLGPGSRRDTPPDRRARTLTRRPDPTRPWIGRIVGIRVAATATGVALTVAAAALGLGGVWTPATTAVAMAIAASLLLVGEAGERILYFMTIVHDRMPGTLR